MKHEHPNGLSTKYRPWGSRTSFDVRQCRHYGKNHFAASTDTTGRPRRSSTIRRKTPVGLVEIPLHMLSVTYKVERPDSLRYDVCLLIPDPSEQAIMTHDRDPGESWHRMLSAPSWPEYEYRSRYSIRDRVARWCITPIDRKAGKFDLPEQCNTLGGLEYISVKPSLLASMTRPSIY